MEVQNVERKMYFLQQKSANRYKYTFSQSLFVVFQKLWRYESKYKKQTLAALFSKAWSSNKVPCLVQAYSLTYEKMSGWIVSIAKCRKHFDDLSIRGVPEKTSNVERKFTPPKNCKF